MKKLLYTAQYSQMCPTIKVYVLYRMQFKVVPNISVSKHQLNKNLNGKSR